MPRFPMYPASGTGIAIQRLGKSIRFARYGCTNRPFYHIVVQHTINDNRRHAPIEQVGSYDPVPNIRNEKLVALNFERIQHWMAKGAQLSKPVAELLGLVGFLPVHPRSYLRAWRNRRAKEETVKDSELKE